jgi:hypothetical protein
MAITPESKNWTWVLERPCGDCGFVTANYPRERLGAAIRLVAARWVPVLRRDDVATRPNDSTWSPLEYSCHVRDVYRIFDYRLNRILTEDEPHFANWDQDVTAEEDRYNAQDPQVVAMQIIAAGEIFANRYDSVRPEQWERKGLRSDGSHFTAETLGRYMIHDPLHHLWDVGAG